jgi:hypothetical protein
MNAHDILRSRFISLSEGNYMVVQDEVDADICVGSDLNDYCLQDIERGFTLEDKVWFRVGVIPIEEASKFYLVLTLHHIVYDGWCLERIFNDFIASYNGKPLKKSTDFKRLIDFNITNDEVESENFWRTYLSESSLSSTIKLPKPARIEFSDPKSVRMAVSAKMEDIKAAARMQQTTIAVLGKAAWALTLKTFTQENDVVFGCVYSGRDIPIPGIEE